MDTRRGGWWLGGLCTAVLVGSLCFSPPSEANVYKWKDAQGRIHYTDRPPPPDGVLISIEQNYYIKRTPEPSAPAAASNASMRTPPAGPDATNPAEAARLKQQVADDVANAQSEGCKAAKERYQNYIQTQRLYKEGPNKERVYLSDSELTEARVNAKRDMDEACAAVR